MSMFRPSGNRCARTRLSRIQTSTVMPHSAFKFLLLLSAFSATLSSAAVLEARAAPDNTVSITSTTNYCMIMPRTAHTNIGDSEHPGGMQSYCSASAHSSPSQGTLPGNFWRNVAFKSGNGKNGKKYAQLTGCINASSLDRLNPHDGGGAIRLERRGGWKGKSPGIRLCWVRFKISPLNSDTAPH
ncbi:putative allergen protein [Mycena sanguinolenta]|uniref:Putative allergen protein n=1 Tax=Mycena sanguinolenta TaxID=230812 RepID=A0A8H7DLJ7_9AGAR|nr:putative allergen protein [Mycena sanguinolenta]